MKKRKKKGRPIKDNFVVTVTRDEMVEFNEAYNRLRDEKGRDAPILQSIAAAEVFPDEEDINERVSLGIRSRALSQLMMDEDLPGWCRPENKDGSVDTHYALFQAAATEPLRARKNELGGDDITFDKESFLKAAFRYAKDREDAEF